jgi:hypothetical protein
MKRTYQIVNGKLVQTGGAPDTESDRARRQRQLHDMLRERQAPGAQTDTSYAAGMHTLEDQWGAKDAARIRKDAKQNYGIDVGNRLYNPCLVPRGAKPGHPEAFYEGRTEHRRKLAASVAEKEPVPVKPHVAPDIVTDAVRARVVAEPELKRLPLKEKRAFRQKVQQELTPKL